MKNLFKRICVIIFSVYLCIAHPVAALADINDIIRNQYIAASVAVASLFSAFGFIPKAGNAALAEMVQDCVSDAQQAGYTVIRNGVPSVGIAISEGYTYLSKAFVSWVYSWSADNLTGVTSDEVIHFPTPDVNLSYTFLPFTGSWTELCDFDYPPEMVSIIENDWYNRYGTNLSDCNYFVYQLYNTTYEGYRRVAIGGLNVTPNSVVTINRHVTDGNSDYFIVNLDGSHSNIQATLFLWKYNNDGELQYQLATAGTGRYFGKGKYYTSSTTYRDVWSSLNVSIQSTTVGWDTTGDNPSKVHDIDEYATTWAGDRTKQVDIDGTNQEGVPTTIPIDDVAVNVHVTVPAADIISGLADAINAALDMSQSVAREGAISTSAVDELEKENVATDNAISLEDAQPIVSDILGWGIDYVKPHLSNVFQKYPFSIPYDFYLILNALYSGANSPQRLRAIKVTSSSSGGGGGGGAWGEDPSSSGGGGGGGAWGEDPSNVGIVVDFEYVSKENSGAGSVAENDPNAPKFDYDFYVSAFDKQFHFVGSLDFAPFGGLIKLCKVGIGLLWLCTLLMWNYNNIHGGNGGGK